MLLERLRLTNVRCHAALDVKVGPHFTVLVGPNGAGKTSVLEAAHLALAGASPRTSSPREAIRHGEAVTRVEADLRDASGERVTVAIGYDRAGDRRLSCAGVSLPDCSRLEALAPVRMFLPDHLQLVKGGPRPRRQHLDRLAGAQEPGFRQDAADYDEALRQRNHLLRQGIVGADHAPWEAILAARGLAVARARARALARFAPLFTEVYAALARGGLGSGAGPGGPGPGSDQASLVYRTTVADLDEADYRDRLAEERGRDRQGGLTRLGPHRDDFRVLLDGRDLRESGSQGEQRTAVLALLLAERSWITGEHGTVPILLLDDVMSELDEGRRRAFVSLLGGGQALITTTDLHYFTEQELVDAMVVEIGGAT